MKLAPLVFVSAFLGIVSSVDWRKVQVANLHLYKCDSYPDIVSLEDVSIKIGDDSQIHVSGTLRATKNLTAPIKTELLIKRKTWIGWIKMPCIKGLGSCTFEDLCAYGYPENKDCPSRFVENDVPRRCPIPMGTYTLPKSTFQNTDDRFVFTGKYKGHVLVTHLNYRLSCYNLNFQLVDK